MTIKKGEIAVPFDGLGPLVRAGRKHSFTSKCSLAACIFIALGSNI